MLKIEAKDNLQILHPFRNCLFMSKCLCLGKIFLSHLREHKFRHNFNDFNENYDSTVNKIIISSVMEFIIKSKRFEDALIQR